MPFDFQLTLWVGTRASVFDRTLQRFVVSYDLWEEKFSIVKQRGFSVRGGSEAWKPGGPFQTSLPRRPKPGA